MNNPDQPREKPPQGEVPEKPSVKLSPDLQRSVDRTNRINVLQKQISDSIGDSSLKLELARLQLEDTTEDWQKAPGGSEQKLDLFKKQTALKKEIQRLQRGVNIDQLKIKIAHSAAEMKKMPENAQDMDLMARDSDLRLNLARLQLEEITEEWAKAPNGSEQKLALSKQLKPLEDEMKKQELNVAQAAEFKRFAIARKLAEAQSKTDEAVLSGPAVRREGIQVDRAAIQKLMRENEERRLGNAAVAAGDTSPSNNPSQYARNIDAIPSPDGPPLPPRAKVPQQPRGF